MQFQFVSNAKLTRFDDQISIPNDCSSHTAEQDRSSGPVVAAVGRWLHEP